MNAASVWTSAMKILHVTKKYPPLFGGDAQVVRNLKREQEKMGHEVHVLTHRPREEEEGMQDDGTRKEAKERGVHYFGKPVEDLDRFSLSRLSSLSSFSRALKELLAEMKLDIIHAHSPELGYKASRIGKKLGISTIITAHGVAFPYPQFSWVKRTGEAFLFKHGGFSSIVTVDTASLPAFKRRGMDQAVFLPNGVTPEAMEIERKGDGRTLLVVGRLEEQKGIGYLLEALGLMPSASEWRLVVVGDGGERERLENMASGLAGWEVDLVGGIADEKLRALYSTSEIFVLPSIFEGFPLVILEAWAARLPVIATQVGSIPDVCKNGGALVVPPRDPQALARAIQKLTGSPELRREMGIKGRALVEERYTWDKINQSYEKLYQQAIEDH
ncbi:MAG: glycosyltransferase family 4 protein [Thermoplasmata archaeon]|nr:glycosyltransferase family 4 protein [Thermoplasmata archaeon]